MKIKRLNQAEKRGHTEEERVETGMGLTKRGEIQRQRNGEEGSGTGTEGE